MSGGGPAGEAGERLPFCTLPVAAAWAPNGGRSGETSERGYESLANPRWDLQDFRSFLALVVAGASLDHTLAGFYLIVQMDSGKKGPCPFLSQVQTHSDPGLTNRPKLPFLLLA